MKASRAVATQAQAAERQALATETAAAGIARLEAMLTVATNLVCDQNAAIRDLQAQIAALQPAPGGTLNGKK